MHQSQGQIVRDSVPAVDPAAPRTRRSWEWVCTALVNKERGDCTVDILDTVFLQREQIWSWYYSSSGGVIRKKAQRKLTVGNVVQQFSDVARTYEKNAAGYVALCWVDDQKRLQLMTAAECQVFLTTFKGNSCVSAFRHPRGDLDPTRYANMEHEYTLHKSGRLQGKLYRLAMGSQRIMSMDNKLNSVVNEIIHTVVSYLERNKKCRVVHCISYLVMDDFGRVMLWKTDECQTIAALGTGGGGRGDATTAASNEMGIYDGPHAVSERVLARAKADASKKPDEKLIHAILSSPTPASKRQTLLLQASASQPTLPSNEDPFARFDRQSADSPMSQLRTKADWEQAMQYLPTSSSLSRDRKRTLSAAHLMSSQKKGCCGDYCDLDMRKWTSKRLTNKPALPIVVPWMDSESSAGPGTGLGKLGGGRSSSVVTATLAASAFLTNHPDNSLDDTLGIQKPMSPQRQQMGELAASAKLHTIPFKLVAQGRAEKQLVDLFIRRYQKGEDGEYLAEVYYGDGEPLGQTFPGYYYQEVQVCSNCFTLYTLVETVRMKALSHVAKSRATGKPHTRTSQSRSRAGRSPGGLVALSEARDDLDDSDDDDERLAQKALRTWQRVWRHAQSVVVPSISKKDTAELFSFVNPHPAVDMVVTALGILLCDRSTTKDNTHFTPMDAKRLLSQDKLLLQLQQFDLDEVAFARVERAAAYARNRLFTPTNIAPISSCSARFCDWILTVLQAYAWKNVQLFQNDPRTWETLAFLNSELVPPSIPPRLFMETFFKSSVSPLQQQQQPVVNESVLSTSTKKKKPKNASSTAAATAATTSSSAVRKAIQDQQMKRLAAPTGFVDALASGGSGDAVFTCRDGVTQIPYTITGQAVGANTKCNLVVFNDLFDTMESTKVFFRPIVSKHIGTRALFFNLPGQAGSNYPSSSSTMNEGAAVVLNNVWCAARVHELLEYLQERSLFITCGLPFHLVGFGNGANIATSFAIQFGETANYVDDLQSLVLLNGFAKVDAQLAAILHSTVNVFGCLPPARPDLPVSFFAKYLFSDAYLAKIDVNLALSIYTAVTNAITLDGRIRVCQGALHHVDLCSQLPQIKVPLVLVQSVENALVAPTSVDPFLQQRVNIAHSWSHTQQQSQPQGASVVASSAEPLTSKTKKQVQQVLRTRGSAFVSWLRAGHELRQEAKQYVVDLLEVVVCSKETKETSTTTTMAADGSIYPQPSTHAAVEEDLATHSPQKKTQPPSRATTSANANANANSTLPSPSITDPTSVGGHQDNQQQPSTSQTRQTPLPSAKPNDLSISSTQPASEKRTPQTPAVSVSSPTRVSPLFPRTTMPSPVPTKTSTPKQHQQLVPSTGEVVANPTPMVERTSQIEHASGAAAVAMTEKPKPTAAQPVEVPVPVAPVIRQGRQPKEEQLTAKSLATTTAAATRSSIDDEMDAVRAKMQAEEQRLTQQAEQLRERQRRAAEERMDALRQEQDRRRRQWEEEDAARLEALEKKLRDEQEQRESERKNREQILLAADTAALVLLSRSPEPTPPVEAVAVAVRATRSSDLVAATPQEMKHHIRMEPDLPSVFDQMEAEEKATKRIGPLRVDTFDDVKTKMAQNYSHHVKEHDSFLKQELFKRKHVHAVKIQSHMRRFLAVQRVFKLRKDAQETRIKKFAGSEIVRIVRGFLGRRRFLKSKQQRNLETRRLASALAIQRLFRGFVCRVKFHKLLRNKRALVIQRVYRGHTGRAYCETRRVLQSQKKFMDQQAAKVQAAWRMHTARDKFLTQRISLLAATEIQRMYRGHLGRVEATRKKNWRDAEPGPERLALGLKMIEGSKQAFERQQHEIDALHRAQEAVEKQVSSIHAELQDSEKELAILEKELQDIDQLEADLKELTHEAEMLHNGGLEAILRTNAVASAAATGSSSSHKPTAVQPLGNGVPGSAQAPYEKGMEALFEGKGDMKKRQADAYALEMAIQIKRAEREKKKKDLEAEFTSVFAEVQQKRHVLHEMEDKLADMEATRMRKDREFARMQRNLMELLEEQKLELENLREKGIELEAATATSAAAAAATAMKAKEHEKRSHAMFESTEELMKFQFMSMSLSYFSSLNMLKNLRDINADTTSAAISSTAETAAAAAAAAAAANIPTMNRLHVGGSDLMLAASQLKKNELAQKQKEEQDAKLSSQQPLPEQVKDWNVDDVGRWLDSLSLPQYKKAFQEGAVDGAFLLELRTDDMADVLGVSHKLHVRKIVVARNKLLPLSQQEQLQLDAVDHEDHARLARQGGGGGGGSGSSSVASGGGGSPATAAGAGSLDPDTVFSQARNGRMKRLIESIDAGFDINTEDDKGNTLLLLACQNVNMKMVEYLVAKRGNVNHKNAQGNTPLHFAMAYDSEGKLGEYLIAHGADDTIENSYGLTAYDGLQPE